MDITDLYDKDIDEIGKIYGMLMRKWSRRSNSQQNLSEFAKETEYEFYKAGFLVHVNLSPVLWGQAPLLDIVGRVSGAAEHKDGLDHEKKRFEVLDSKVKGEEYRGQRERAN